MRWFVVAIFNVRQKKKIEQIKLEETTFPQKMESKKNGEYIL